MYCDYGSRSAVWSSYIDEECGRFGRMKVICGVATERVYLDTSKNNVGCKEGSRNFMWTTLCNRDRTRDRAAYAYEAEHILQMHTFCLPPSTHGAWIPLPVSNQFRLPSFEDLTSLRLPLNHIDFVCTRRVSHFYAETHIGQLMFYGYLAVPVIPVLR